MKSFLLSLVVLLLPIPAHAHGGEDHGEHAAAPVAAASLPRFEAKSPDIELVAELHGEKLILYADSYAGNEPVLDAKIEIEGENHKIVATASPDGSYSAPTPWLAHPGKHDLVVTLQTKNIDDLLIGVIEIPTAATAVAATQPLPQQWKNRYALLGGGGMLALLVATLIFRLVLVARRRKRTSKPAQEPLLPLLLLIAVLPVLLALHNPSAFAHGGEDHGDAPHPVAANPGQPSRLADGSVFVPKAAQRAWGIRTETAAISDRPFSIELNGHIVADPTYSGRVQSSQPGRIESEPKGVPHLGSRVAKGEVLAWLTPITGNLERGASLAQLAEINAQSALAEKRLARLGQLEGIVPEKEVESLRAELLGLTERKAALSGALNRKEALRAPVGGIISAVNITAGQVVEARETLFEIINPDKLMVEAIAYDPALPSQIAAASAAGADGKPFKLAYLGSGGQLRDHALPLQFRIVPPLPALNVAQPVRVAVETSRRVKAVAAPQSAVVKNTGSDTFVWLHVSAERFVPRRVQTQALDAAHVAIPEGVQAGERIVVRGAALLNQVH
ncbi:MAG: HlyD family efflux transporter periplasmic adaptor subunit [Sulfuricellaceae bacterium]